MYFEWSVYLRRAQLLREILFTEKLGLEDVSKVLLLVAKHSRFP